MFVSMCFSSFSIFNFSFIFYFFYINFCQFLCLWVCLLVYLPATLHHSLYLVSVFTRIASFDVAVQPLFSLIITHLFFLLFFFIFSSAHWGRIQDIQFERHGLPLTVCCMGKPFKVSTNYFCVAKGNLLFLSVF